MNDDKEKYEDIEQRVRLVGEYFRQIGESTRQIAKYFTENYFPISNKTVSKYIHKYVEIAPNYEEEILKKINVNTEKDITTDERQKLMLIESELLSKGYNIQEIAYILDLSYSSVQRDLTTRLANLAKDDQIYNELYLSVFNQLRNNQNTIVGNREK